MITLISTVIIIYILSYLLTNLFLKLFSSKFKAIICEITAFTIITYLVLGFKDSFVSPDTRFWLLIALLIHGLALLCRFYSKNKIKAFILYFLSTIPFLFCGLISLALGCKSTGDSADTSACDTSCYKDTPNVDSIDAYDSTGGHYQIKISIYEPQR